MMIYEDTIIYDGESVYGNYRTRKFTDIFEDVSAFISEYSASGIPTTISTESATTLYYLLYARYGNSHIANNDETQFRYKLWSIIYQYGPTWEKKLEIQKTIRGMSESDLRMASKSINNLSMNPSSAPSTSSLEELDTINQQSTDSYSVGKIDAYGKLWDLLVADVTEQFLTKFRKLFLIVVEPQLPLWYTTEVSE